MAKGSNTTRNGGSSTTRASQLSGGGRAKVGGDIDVRLSSGLHFSSMDGTGNKATIMFGYSSEQPNFRTYNYKDAADANRHIARAKEILSRSNHPDEELKKNGWK